MKLLMCVEKDEFGLLKVGSTYTWSHHKVCQCGGTWVAVVEHPAPNSRLTCPRCGRPITDGYYGFFHRRFIELNDPSFKGEDVGEDLKIPVQGGRDKAPTKVGSS